LPDIPLSRPTHPSPSWALASFLLLHLRTFVGLRIQKRQARRSSWLCASVSSGHRPSQRASFGFSTSAISRWILRICSSSSSEAISQASCISV
jgi:uncharacterized protein (DUF2236 family)